MCICICLIVNRFVWILQINISCLARNNSHPAFVFFYRMRSEEGNFNGDTDGMMKGNGVLDDKCLAVIVGFNRAIFLVFLFVLCVCCCC